MTFFNKKTEVMEIEMTPYGRYLYSIGKFKPHSYEFVDDDVVYRISGSGEAQEASHQRIINETPKMKINRSSQNTDGIFQSEDVFVDSKRQVNLKMDQRQNSQYVLGKSSFSSDSAPGIQLKMLRGHISGSNKVQTFDSGSLILIPQVDIDYNFDIVKKSELDESSSGKELVSDLTSNGQYFEIESHNMIMELKEFGSIYEKDNFEIEVYHSGSDGNYRQLFFSPRSSLIVNDMLVEDVPMANMSGFPEEPVLDIDSSFVDYFFSIDFDEQIDREELCEVIESLEIIDQFLDSELECPDIRTERFDIYATRVGPEDLEDCD